MDIRKYSVIYDAIEEVKAAMEGMLAPTLKEQITATIEVREVFNINKGGLVAGAVVKTGKVKRSDKARLIRDGRGRKNSHFITDIQSDKLHQSPCIHQCPYRQTILPRLTHQTGGNEMCIRDSL